MPAAAGYRQSRIRRTQVSTLAPRQVRRGHRRRGGRRDYSARKGASHYAALIRGPVLRAAARRPSIRGDGERNLCVVSANGPLCPRASTFLVAMGKQLAAAAGAAASSPHRDSRLRHGHDPDRSLTGCARRLRVSAAGVRVLYREARVWGVPVNEATFALIVIDSVGNLLKTEPFGSPRGVLERVEALKREWPEARRIQICANGTPLFSIDLD